MQPQVAELPRLLKAPEIAQATGLPLARVYALARRGDMPVIRLGRAMRFDPHQVAEFFRAGGTNGNGNS